MAELELKRQGYEIKEFRAVFRDFKEPGIPDIVAVLEGRITKGNGRREDSYDRLIIEIETKPTKAHSEKKIEQFGKIKGWNLKILDARKIKNWRRGWGGLKVQDIKDWLRANL
jgi:hypothetical protein